MNPTFYEPASKDLEQVRTMLLGFPNVPYPWLSRLLSHVLGDGSGKMLRPTLTILSGKCLGYRADLHISMAASLELLHTATLVHDDAVDSSSLRRGKATLNALWDAPTSVLVGDYLFALAAELAAGTGNLDVIRLFARTLMDICKGELEERHFAYRTDVTRDQYYKRIALKTASLFSAATESGALLSQAPTDHTTAMRDYGHLLGMAFQVVDDILDFVGDERQMGKPVGSDLLQGTVTLPALLLLERQQEDNPIAAMFQGPGHEGDLSKAVSLIRNSSIINESYVVAHDFQDRACQALRDLPHSPFKQALLDIAAYSVQRLR